MSIVISKAAARKLGFGSKRSKFNVDQSAAGIQKRTHGGVVFSSEAEMRFAQDLELKQRVGLITEIMRQVAVPLIVNGQRISTMRVDFRVVWADGLVELIEVKGKATAAFRLQHKLLKALHPDLNYRVVKAR